MLNLLRVLKAIKTKNPAFITGLIVYQIKFYQSTFTFPFTFAITSSAMFVGAGE